MLGFYLQYNKFVFEKSIVSAKELAAGHVISAADLAYKKPGDGIPAKEYKNIINENTAYAPYLN